MNAPLQLNPDRKRERHKFTLDDVFRMQEAGILPSEPKVELIEGELVQMAARNARHMLAKQALNRLLIRLEPAIAYHVERTLRLSPTSSPTPDIFVHRPDLRPD